MYYIGVLNAQDPFNTINYLTAAVSTVIESTLITAESATTEVESVLDEVVVEFELHAVIVAVKAIANAKITFFIFFFLFGFIKKHIEFISIFVELRGFEPRCCSANTKDSFTGLFSFSKLTKYRVCSATPTRKL